MSLSISILKSLKFKDININFYGNFISEQSIKNKRSLVYHDYLTESICFDKFKSVKSADGAMSFNMCNADTGKTIDIVDYILDQNKQLKETYQVYQELLYAIQNKDTKVFDEVISKQYNNISEYMKTSLNTLISFKELIHNSLNTNLSNGFVEGNNNLIKTIKRISFVFISFRRFKTIIMIITGLLKSNKKEVEFC